MRKYIFFLLIIAGFSNFLVFSQSIKTVNLCCENDWKVNQVMTAQNDSIYELQVDIDKNKDLDKNYYVSTKFKILYDNGFKWIGGTFPNDTIGDMETYIQVPYGSYLVKINVNTFKYQFIDLENNFYKFSETELDSNEFIYCRIVGYSKILSNKVTVEIDFGQYRPIFKDNRLTDKETGQTLVFNSMIDALNYMGKLDWEFVQAYAITIYNQNVYHYLLKKKNF